MKAQPREIAQCKAIAEPRKPSKALVIAKWVGHKNQPPNGT
jgi:hypothetical protein